MPRFRLAWLVIVLASLFPAAVDGGSLRVTATHAGVPVPDVVACAYRSDPHDQLRDLFLLEGLRCGSQGGALELEPGEWHVFAHDRSGLTSGGSNTVTVADAPVGALQSIGVELIPAARARFDLLLPVATSRRIVAYFPGSETEPAFALPLAAGSEDMLVPAGRAFLPVIAGEGEPVFVGMAHTGERRRMIHVDSRPLSERTLVGWIQYDRDALGRREADEPLTTPAIAAVFEAGKRLQPMFPQRSVDRPELVVIPNVPPVDLALETGGKQWLPTRENVEAATQDVAVRVVRDPLRPVLPGALTVEWNVDPMILLAGTRCPEGESGTERGEAALRLTFMQCESPPSSRPSEIPPWCRQAGELRSVAAATTGSTRVDGIPPESNWLRVELPAGASWDESFSLRSGEHLRLRVEPRFESLSGRVTSAGEPVAATLRFRPFAAAVSDESTGHYRVFLKRPHGSAPIIVQRCGSESLYVDLPERSLENGDIHDIDLEEREISVKTVDAATRQPVAQADCQLRFDVEDVGVSLYQLKRTDEEGRSNSPKLSERAEDALRRAKPGICCRHSEFAEACADLPQAEESSQEIVLALSRKAGRRGRILSDAPVIGGRILLVSPATGAKATEPVERDGAFSMAHPLALDDYLVFVSRSHPLQRFRLPRTEMPVLELQAGGAPVREARIHPPAGMAEPRAIGLAIGNDFIPAVAFTFHQAMRGRQPDLAPGQILTVSDIVESGPIELILGYAVSEVPPSADGWQPDFLFLPEHRRLFRRIPLGQSPDLRP